MAAATSGLGIRGRLLAGFVLICVLLAATVGYTVYVMSDINARVNRVVVQRAPVAINPATMFAEVTGMINEEEGLEESPAPCARSTR